MQGKGSALDLSEYILRVYTDDYRYRLSFKPQQTYSQLLNILSHKTGIPPQQLQVHSENGRRLNILPSKQLKEVVYLRHGSILRVDLNNKQKRAASPQSNIYIHNYNPPIQKKAKSKCKHPSNMRCLSCLPNQKENTHYAGNGILTVPKGKPEDSKRRQCDHGANMKCLNCLDSKQEKKIEQNKIEGKKVEKEPVMIGSPKKEEKRKSKLQLTIASPKNNPQSPQICRHGPNIKCQKCINSPKNTLKNSKSQPLLNTFSSIPSPQKSPQKQKSPQNKKPCLHGETGKCLNCLPLKQQQQKQPQTSNKKCNHSANSKCIHCIPTTPTKVAHIAFDQYLKTKSINCISHPKGNQCPNCQPPTNLRLSLNTNCRQHQPYPKGLCNRCIPQNVTLKSQEYRHVDYVQFMNNNQIQDFIRYWVQQKKMGETRVAFVYGYYAEDPFYKNGIRAIVEAIYEPEQKCTKNSFTLKDSAKKKERVEMIADGLGLEKIGIMIASPKEEGYFTEEQIRMIADLQQSLSVQHQTGYKLSNFFTVLIKANKADPNLIEPQIFMVSDQGQALQAASMFVPNPSNPDKMKLKQSQTEILPQVYQQGKPVNEFDIEFLLVKVASGVSKSNKFAILKNNEFPVYNRAGIKKSTLKEYISKHGKKPNSIKYGDLTLLLFIGDLLDIETSLQVARRIQVQQQIDPALNSLIDKKLQTLL